MNRSSKHRNADRFSNSIIRSTSNRNLMNRTSEHHGADRQGWSWITRCSIFSGLFGIIWMFIEPLLAFLGEARLLSFLGLWRYVVLIMFSALLTISIEYFNKMRLLSKLASISGIIAFYPKRSTLTTVWWENFFSEHKNPHEVLMMGQSISRAFKNSNLTKAFIKYCKNGAKVRILFLSPSNTELAQLQNVGKGMLRTFSMDPVENLEKKIHKSIADLDEHVIFNVSDISKKPMVRYATRDLPFSLMAIGNEMVTTLYGTEAEGDEQPTFLIKGKDSDAYKSFIAEFERIWHGYSKVSPYMDPVIVEYMKEWHRYIGLRNFNTNIPPPFQVIVFPTYRCEENCSYCMFSGARTNGNIDEMDPENLHKTITQLLCFGVKRFEISGGGEPLEHRKIGDILTRLKDLRDSHPHIKFGLLTNGCHLDIIKSSEILQVFNDYIRVSRCERIGQVGNEENLAKWKNNIAALLALKRNDPTINTKIGIKYLLAHSNQDRFVQMVRDDLSDRNLVDVDYLRFRSERNVDKNKIVEVEQQVYYIIKSLGFFNSPEKVSLSLSNFIYPRNFQCWISPMNVIIVPNGEVYICCNYLHDRNNKCLGNILTHNFKSMWNTSHHLELRKRLRKVNCDRQQYCDCRYAEIQEALERISFMVDV